MSNTHYADNRFERDPPIRTSAGAVIRLPVSFDPSEATLAGNAQEFAGGVVAVYDGVSRTGAVFIPSLHRWVMQQPVEREEFLRAVAAGHNTEAALGDVAPNTH